MRFSNLATCCVIGLFFVGGVGASEWIRIGPDAGEVTALAAHPSDPEIAVAGTDDAGIFRTQDGAESWSHAGLRGFGITVIRFSASDPTRVYAGLTPWSQNQVPGGVFVSDDGGLSWTAARNGLEDYVYPPGSGWFHYLEVNDLAVDPENSSVVWAATNQGLFKTTNAGVSWSRVPEFGGGHGLWAVTVTSGDPPVDFVSWPHHGVVKSDDGGETWNDASTGLLLPDHNGHLLLYSPDEMLEAPWTSDVLFGRVGSKHLVRYDATENAWSRVESLDAVPPRGGWQGRLFTDAASGPQGSQDLWMGTVWNGVIRSTDGGASWTNTESVGLDCEDLLAGRDSFLEIPELAVFAGSGERVIASTVARSIVRSLDGGSTWHSASGGLSNSYPNSVLIDQSQSEHMVSSTDRQGLFYTADGGNTWTEVLSREVFPCAYWGPNPWSFPPPDCWSWGEIRRQPNGGLMVGGGCGTYVSFDRGADWQEAGEQDLWPLGHSSDDQLWYVQDSPGQVLRGDGEVPNWQACGELPSAPYPDRLIEAVVFHDSASEVAVVGRYGDVFRTEDGCQSWTETGEAFAGCRIYWLGVDPEHVGRYLVSNSCGLWESTDHALTWELVDFPETTVYEFLFDPERLNVVYARTDPGGVLYSTDRGENWRPLGQELGEGWVTDLALDPDGSALYAAVYGDGVYRLSLPPRFDRVNVAEPR